ncbi:unnamed protein product [Taenia asiatica]|uniref:WKF domain-containing protein n=1 Tax=Taenia asiatica TaxID=60517 RepID=A0A0R3W7C0_TAEAS|nr:unnamed protein product [Taenia asiatica]
MTIEAALKPSKKHKKLSEFGNGDQATEEGSQPSGRKRKTRPTELNESRATEVSTEAEASRPTKRRKKSLEGAIDSTEERKAVSHWQQKSERDLENCSSVNLNTLCALAITVFHLALLCEFFFFFRHDRKLDDYLVTKFIIILSLEKNVTETKKPESVKKSVKFAEELVTSGSLPKNKSKTSILKVSSPSAKASNENSGVEKANEADGNGAETKVRKPKKSKNALKRIKWVKRHHKKTFSRRQRRANRELARSRPQRNAEQHLAEAVEYLNTWYSSPETWKYKKVAQLTLIKHAFNPVLIDEETFELLLHYLAGVQGAVVNRLRSMCQQLIDNGGKPLESPTFPLSIPCDCQDSHVVIERATKMLEFVLPPAAGI